MAVMVWQDFLQFLTFTLALVNFCFLVYLYKRVGTVIETHGLLNEKKPLVNKRKSPLLPVANEGF